jgi:hypothetical protein
MSEHRRTARLTPTTLLAPDAVTRTTNNEHNKYRSGIVSSLTNVISVVRRRDMIAS